ncbi:MAG: hypothetical protein JW993_16175 [Sedimentisphaerales bacterium]|nr:hypothetical protein [Sedimentisphaerales bacterium]
MVPNRPPTITLISPEDGVEIFRPAALILRADATDPDGTVLEVRYFVECRWDSSMWGMELLGSAFAQSWEAKFSTWSNVPFDGTYTVWAEATDNEGATSTSPAITVTLHP